MPFMKGRAPVRRTLKYLQSSQLILKDEIQIMTLNYNHGQKANRGALEFVFWHLPQLMHKNRNVQFVTFKNMTPTPFFQFFMSSGKKLVVDVDSRSKEEIHDFLKHSVCKTESQIKEEQFKEKVNPAYFGPNCLRHCICQIPGQVPCSGYVSLPPDMLGKNYLNKEQ